MATRTRGPEDSYPQHTKVEPTKDGIRYELTCRLSGGRRGVVVVITTFDKLDDPTISIWEIARERR